jgi:hypothetical protein
MWHVGIDLHRATVVLDPRLASSLFSCCYDPGKSEEPGLDSATVMGVPRTLICENL